MLLVQLEDRVAPVPLRAIMVGELEALLASDRLPVTLPVTAGANFTWKVALCPAASVAGKVRPLRLKPLPVTLACEMVTLLVLAVTVTFCAELLPVSTLPKLSEFGLAAKVPAVVPVPLRAITVGELEALLASDRLPVTLPVAVGANFTWKVALCPAASVAGKVRPLRLKPLPVTVAWEMVTLLVLAVTVTFCVELLPVSTLPKLSEVGLAAKVPAVGARAKLQKVAPLTLSQMMLTELRPVTVCCVERKG